MEEKSALKQQLGPAMAVGWVVWWVVAGVSTALGLAEIVARVNGPALMKLVMQPDGKATLLAGAALGAAAVAFAWRNRREVPRL